MTAAVIARQTGRRSRLGRLSLSLRLALLAACVIPAIRLNAQGSQVVNYQGRLAIAGTNFSGTAQFKFAILNNRGSLLWAMLPLPETGSTETLPGAITVSVQDGLYGVRLGDVSAGMPALDAAMLQGELRLRIWFKDPARGWQMVASDTPLALGAGSGSDHRAASMTVAQADEMLRELRAIHLLLERQQRSPSAGTAQPARQPDPVDATVPLANTNTASMGDSNAPLVLVEFTDFQCDYCRQFHDVVFPELKKNYIDTGKLRFVARNLALPFHKQAEPAALAALCAHAQDKYWGMRDQLFIHTASLSADTINMSATKAGLDMVKFKACLDARAFAAELEQDRKVAEAAGINGTPTFVLGRADANGLVTGRLILGAQPLSHFETEIKRLLSNNVPAK